MPGYLMSRGMIDAFFAGADRITEKGHVINKIGTFPTAACANYFHLPFYAYGLGADPGSKDVGDVEIELRDPEEVLCCLGRRTASTNAKLRGFYPAFDVTPPEFVAGIVTDKGVYPPERLHEYVRDDVPTERRQA